MSEPRKVSPSTISEGDRFGLLTVISAGEVRDARGRRAILLRCDCGSERTADSWHLRAGKVKSCGCRRDALVSETLTQHGHARVGRHSAEYRTWCAIKKRCFSQSEPSFAKYGARGITVCQRWRDSFEAFLADMGPRPPGTSIGRIDNDGNYEPGNCRWETPAQQARNKRNSRIVFFLGRSMSLAEACEVSGVPYKKAHDRLKDGWSVDRALQP